MLEQLDQELEKDANVKVLRRDQRTIQFLFGEVTFKRRLVEETGGYHVYLLDRHLGIKPRKRYSPLLLAQVSGLASKGVMRTVASAVNLLTPISMSHQKVAGVIKEAGARIDNYQRQQGINDTVGKNKPVILYLEGDAFSVKQQAFHHNRQIRNLFVHRFQIYEGIRKNGKRRELINRHIISSLDRQQAMKEVSEYLQAHYDLKKTIIISGSDNGSGYEAEVFKELAPDCLKQEHFLDQYHLNRKLQERLSFDFELIKPMKKAVYSWNWDQVRVILDTAESRITKEDQAGQEKRMALRKLENYLKRNWQYIKPAKLRGVKKPNGLGSCESNHRRYTYRLKRQGRSWSKAGLY
ncbi:ISLre2 family transposase [Liquorilactobacillus mali]|uniref:ISLre2 family transposase n=1 Tax=Liquorilactobacillus mali TaxID=1618 RepID=UPI0039EAC404